MSEQERQRLRELAEKASPGPWIDGLDETPPDPAIEAIGGGCVCWIQCHGNINTMTRLGEEFSHADARFIAASREAIPALLDALDAKDAEIARLRDMQRLLSTYSAIALD